jgi:multiple sugar transport system ATP-binding protein
MIHIANSPIQLTATQGAGALPAAFTLGVRPEDVHPGSQGAYTGTVALIEPLGVETVLHIKAGDQTLVSTVPGMTGLRIGSDVRFDIVRERLHFFNRTGERV